MTLQDLQKIISQLSFRDWECRAMEKGDGFLLQWRFWGKDSVTGEHALQSCRKWYISSHSTELEVVRTAWKAALAAVEHEAGEDFRYRGETIYNPHSDITKPAEVKRTLDARPAPKPDRLVPFGSNTTITPEELLGRPTTANVSNAGGAIAPSIIENPMVVKVPVICTKCKKIAYVPHTVACDVSQHLCTKCNVPPRSEPTPLEKKLKELLGEDLFDLAEHRDHGRGNESGPFDPDCPCSGTIRERICGASGCGFCVAFITKSEKAPKLPDIDLDSDDVRDSNPGRDQ